MLGQKLRVAGFKEILESLNKVIFLFVSRYTSNATMLMLDCARVRALKDIGAVGKQLNKNKS